MTKKTKKKSHYKEKARNNEKECSRCWFFLKKFLEIIYHLFYIALIALSSDEPKHLLCNNLGGADIGQVSIENQNLGFCLYLCYGDSGWHGYVLLLQANSEALE